MTQDSKSKTEQALHDLIYSDEAEDLVRVIHERMRSAIEADRRLDEELRKHGWLAPNEEE